MAAASSRSQPDGAEAQADQRLARHEMDDEHDRADTVGDHGRQRRADDAQRRERTPAQDQRRRQGEMEGLADGDGEGRHHHVAGAARDVGQKVHQPDQDRAAEHHGAVEHGHLDRTAGEAHGGVERGAGGQHQGGGERTADQRDRHRHAGERRGPAMIAGAQRAADRRGDARAEARRGRRLQDQEQREHHGHARQRIAAQPRHEQRIGRQEGDACRGLADVGRGERQQQRQDRCFEDALGAAGQDGHAARVRDGPSPPVDYLASNPSLSRRAKRGL